jgi:predicted AAA+ superfamily ATPase
MGENEITRAHRERIRHQLYKGKTILLYGARRVGKTHLVKSIIEEEGGHYYNAEEPQVRETLSVANTVTLKAFLGEKKLVALDEIQTIQGVGTVLKVMFDTFPEVQIIATGSSSFELINAIAEPLIGRSRHFILYPVSIGELKQSLGYINAYGQIETLLRYGSYPEILFQSEEEKKNELIHICANYLYKDVLAMGGVRRTDLILDILKLLAFQIGQEVSLNEISNRTNTNVHTVQRIIYLLEESYIIHSLRGFSRNLRNEIGKSRKYYFQDLGIRNAIINNFNPLTLRNDVGQLWENFCVMERIKKNEYDRRHVNTYFWRTYDQKEIDYIEEIDGKLYAFEFKWNETPVKPPKIFMEAYPGSEFKVISKNNLFEFI